MQVRLIDDIHQFDQLKTDWESVYVVDPNAHIFVSWMWLRGWFEMTPHSWFVLAVGPDDTSPEVAFLPLTIRGLWIHKFNPIRVLHLGGQPLATYTGFVCSPEHEEESLAALAHYMQQLGWDSFQMEEVVDPRLDFFLSLFPRRGFAIEKTHGMPTVNIALPDSWDSYMQNFVGSKTRRNLRRSFRQIEGHSEFRMTYAQRDSLERDIEILLTFWQWRWGPKPVAQWRRGMIRHFFENDRLWLGVLWDKDTPVAALAALTDQQKRVFYPYIVGHNPTYAKLSPGKVMFGHSIQYAINNGFEVYDFLTGMDKYKFSFGPKPRGTTNIIIRRKGPGSAVANTVVNLSRQASAQSTKMLGKMKRIGIAKRIWFWAQAQLKRVRQ